jgi:hypothetical protein
LTLSKLCKKYLRLIFKMINYRSYFKSPLHKEIVVSTYREIVCEIKYWHDFTTYWVY